MNRFFVKALAVSLVVGASFCAQAEDLKIGYVNSDRVLRDAIPAKAAQAKLEAEFSKRDKEMADIAAKIKSASEKLEKDAPTLSESERSRRQRELQRLGIDRRGRAVPTRMALQPGTDRLDADSIPIEREAGVAQRDRSCRQVQLQLGVASQVALDGGGGEVELQLEVNR